MQFFKVILLVCATSVPRGDCQIDTAAQVINGPDAGNEIACGMMSQAYLAETPIGQLAKDEYLKILRRRSAQPSNHPSLTPGPSSNNDSRNRHSIVIIMDA